MRNYTGPHQEVVNSLFDEERRLEKIEKIPVDAILSRSERYTSEELGKAAIWQLLVKTGSLSIISDYLQRIDYKGGSVFRGISDQDIAAFQTYRDEKPHLQKVYAFLVYDASMLEMDDFFVTEAFLDRILHVSEGNISACLTGDVEDMIESVTMAKLALIGKEYALTVAEKIHLSRL